MAKKPTVTRQAKPPTTEKTGAQCTGGSGGIVSGFGSMLLNGLTAAPRACYDTWRRMLTNPTIAMALAAALAPVKSTKWMYAVDDNGDDRQMEFVQKQMDRLRFGLVRNMTHAVVMGHQPFEMVWEFKDGMWGYHKIKPLLPDITKILVDKQTGEYTGLENSGVELDADHSFNFAYDDDYGCHWGRSRLENIRENAWSPWCDAMKQNASYLQKGAGVVMVVHYPPGQSPDKNGSLTDNADLATSLLQRIGMGKGIGVPKDFGAYADDARELIRAGVDPKSLMAWQIEFMEHRAGVGSEIAASLAYLDKLMSRGLLVPERTFQEGTTGTRADAGAAGDIALQPAEELNQDIADTVNRELVDPLLIQNWGEGAKGAVRIEPAPLGDTDKAFMRDITKAVLSGNPDLFLSLVDVDGAFDLTGIPKAEEVLDPTQMDQHDANDPQHHNDPNHDPQSPDPSPNDPAVMSLRAAVRASMDGREGGKRDRDRKKRRGK